MTGNKPWWKSTTIQGLVAILIPIAAKYLKIDIAPEGARDLVTALFEGVGSILVVWGRVKANTQLSLT